MFQIPQFRGLVKVIEKYSKYIKRKKQVIKAGIMQGFESVGSGAVSL